MIIIGDVHGSSRVRFETKEGVRLGMLSAEQKKDVYFNIVRGLRQPSIQIGDFGFIQEHEWFLKNVDHRKHKVLFGNHDHMPLVDAPHSMGHYRFIPELQMMTIRGAYSIDKSQRTQGVDWFHDEELSMQQCEAVLTMVDQYRPKIILSHDCPTEIGTLITGENKKSRTDQLLQACFDRHQPELWVHGHFHVHHEARVNGTRFLGLGELEVVEI